MATLNQLADGTLVNAGHWNAHVDQINTNTTGISTLESRTTNATTGNTALGNRVGTLETNQGTRGTNGTVYAEIGTLKSTTTSATTGNTALGNRVTTLENNRAGIGYGSWSDNNALSFGQKITNIGSPSVSGDDQGPGGRGVKITDINTVVDTPTSCSFSNGTFTPSIAGKWMFTATTQYGGGVSAIRAVYFAKSSAVDSPTGTKYGLLGGPSADAQAVSAIVKLNANEPVSLYVAVWTEGASVDIWRGKGNVFTAVYLGP